MEGNEHHEEIVSGLFEQLRGIFEGSEQAIYLYLDDEHKVCNDNFASLLGYDSAKKWAQVNGSFPELFVDEGSQEDIIGAYQLAMEKMIGSNFSVVWKKKNGETVNSDVILVPIMYEGHPMALHFISAK